MEKLFQWKQIKILKNPRNYIHLQNKMLQFFFQITFYLDIYFIYILPIIAGISEWKE